MFGKRWRLFRLLGIPISLDASWLIILALISWSLVNVFRAEIPGRPASDMRWSPALGACRYGALRCSCSAEGLAE